MTYTYDAEGERVQKTGGSSGMLYWHAMPEAARGSATSALWRIDIPGTLFQHIWR